MPGMPPRTYVDRRRTKKEASNGQAFRNGHHRRRAGGVVGGLPPGATKPLLPDPGRQRAHRRLVAHAMGFASRFHAGEVQRSARDAIPGAEPLVPDQRRGRGLHVLVRGQVRPPGAQPRLSRSCHTNRARICGYVERRDIRGGHRRRGHRRAPRAEDPGLCEPPRSSNHSDSFERVQESDPAAPGRRACRRRGQLRSRDLVRPLVNASGLLSGNPPGQLPVRHGPAAAAFVLPLVKFLGTYVLTVDTPVGRKVLPKMKTAPLIRMKMNDLRRAGVEQVARVTGAQDGVPLLADGRTLDVANVIWCTGFRSDFRWIQLPAAFGTDGRPLHYRGVVASEPGLYFVGLEHQYAAVSDVLPGIGRDAGYVARHIAGRETLAGRVDSEDGMVRR